MSPRERLFALEQFGIKLGLDNIRALLEALGHPERGFASIHVAGTNGKGSVSAMVERGVRGAGQRTGRYTSPHLAHIEERIAIDGRAVDAASFDAATTDVLETADRLQERGVLIHPPTFFEATTAIAFELFRRAGVTVAVVEVGLGGRFDATNVVQPLLTAITSIAMDHERYLGSTLRDIAFEKAGIIKRGVPVVLGPIPEEPRDVIRRVAEAHGAPVVEARPAVDGRPVTLALEGAHQHANAAVAVQLLKMCTTVGVPVSAEAMVAALTDVHWPARLEWLRLPGLGDVLIDAAHNPAGAQTLAEYVCDTTGPLPLVLGLMRDKDVGGIIRAVAPAAAVIYATIAATHRALDAQELAARARSLVSITVHAQDSPEIALRDAIGASPSNRAIVAGSIFLVGPLRDHLMRQGAVPVRYPSKTAAFYLPE